MKFFRNIGIFTNGAYDVFGIMASKYLRGIVVKSNYPMVYGVGNFVKFYKYHLETDTIPQFYKTNT